MRGIYDVQLINSNSSSARLPEIAEWELGKDEYFVLGDNRDAVNDSRYRGTIKKENIVGVVIKVVDD